MIATGRDSSFNQEKSELYHLFFGDNHKKIV